MVVATLLYVPREYVDRACMNFACVLKYPRTDDRRLTIVDVDVRRTTAGALIDSVDSVDSNTDSFPRSTCCT